jgi:hypothetical protein
MVLTLRLSRPELGHMFTCSLATQMNRRHARSGNGLKRARPGRTIRQVSMKSSERSHRGVRNYIAAADSSSQLVVAERRLLQAVPRGSRRVVGAGGLAQSGFAEIREPQSRIRRRSHRAHREEDVLVRAVTSQSSSPPAPRCPSYPFVCPDNKLRRPRPPSCRDTSGSLPPPPYLPCREAAVRSNCPAVDPVFETVLCASTCNRAGPS